MIHLTNKIAALAMAVGFCLGMGSVTLLSCGKPLPPKSIAALRTIECRYALLEPYLGVLTQELVARTMGGDSRTLARVLADLGLTLEEVSAVAKEWHACQPDNAPTVPATTQPPPLLPPDTVLPIPLPS